MTTLIAVTLIILAGLACYYAARFRRRLRIRREQQPGGTYIAGLDPAEVAEIIRPGRKQSALSRQLALARLEEALGRVQDNSSSDEGEKP